VSHAAVVEQEGSRAFGGVGLPGLAGDIWGSLGGSGIIVIVIIVIIIAIGFVKGVGSLGCWLFCCIMLAHQDRMLVWRALRSMHARNTRAWQGLVLMVGAGRRFGSSDAETA